MLRNKYKRIVREATKRCDEFDGYDLIIMARPKIVVADYHTIYKDIIFLLKRLKILSDIIMLVKISVMLLLGYQKFISPMIGPCCRFYPTCSSYSIGVLKKYGFIKGALLATKRVVRCNPFNSGGYDPVP